MTQSANLGHRRGLLLRLLVSGMVLALWFWTQSLIGARTAPASGIGDALHNLTAGLNSYFAQNTRAADALDRKSTRLNSSHGYISYAVFCLKKKKTNTRADRVVEKKHY